MLTLFFLAAVAVLLAGAAIKFGAAYVASRNGTTNRGFTAVSSISWPEFIVGAIVCCVVIVPVTVWLGEKVAVAERVNYQEYWNGYETQALWSRTTCSRDGSCAHSYSCDPYTVVHTRTVSDGNGKSHTETYTTTEYHDCPYTDEEWTFAVDTTLGQKTIASHVLPTNPDQHRWRNNAGIPSDLRANAGIPPFWAAAKARLDANRPGPVTIRHDYDNYLLASQNTILKKYSAAVKTYLKQGLLPKPATGLRDWYLADKVKFVGPVPAGTTAAAWQNTVNRFNAALGTDLQGDLHVIVVTDPRVTDPNNYAGAISGYWQSPKLGKASVSKNSVILVVGSKDGRTVAWSRASTGMPVGNEQLMQQIATALPGTRLLPSALIGAPVAALVAGKPVLTHSDGKLDSLVWGTNKFQRACMTCNDKSDKGTGYGYLLDEIEPTTGQKWGIFAVAFFLSLLVWGGLLALNDAVLSDFFARFKSDRTAA